MAYTKAPVNDTHNVQRLPVQGTSIVVSNSLTTSASPPSLSYIDCFPKKENQWGTDPIRRVHKRDAFEAISVTGATVTASTTFSRSTVWCENNATAFFALGDNLYRIDNVNTTPTAAVQASSLTGTTQGCSGTLAVNNSNVNKVCFLTSAGYLHTCSEDGSAAAVTNVSSLVNGNGNLVFMNGYLFALSSDGKIYNSSAGGAITTWNATDYLTPEVYPDLAEYIDIHRNHLVAFSRNSVEFFYDGGIEIGSPLVRQESYVSRVGILRTGKAGASTARIGDDIYFIGRSTYDSYNLYRIRDFRVELIDNQYFQNVFNYQDSSSTYQQIYGIQSVIINNNPMIVISGSLGYETIYYPDEDCWWQIRTNGDAGRGLTQVNTDFPGELYRISGSVFPPSPGSPARTRILCRDPNSGNSVKFYCPAIDTSPSLQADMYTEVVDFGIDYYKHLARIDAVGDYGDNTLTLYVNQTPNYGQTYTSALPTRQPSAIGYGRNASWYNIGAVRRFSMQLKMVGTTPAFHKGFDIEYNVGAA